MTSVAAWLARHVGDITSGGDEWAEPDHREADLIKARARRDHWQREVERLERKE